MTVIALKRIMQEHNWSEPGLVCPNPITEDVSARYLIMCAMHILRCNALAEEDVIPLFNKFYGKDLWEEDITEVLMDEILRFCILYSDIYFKCGGPLCQKN